ncbi:hypothetical protein GCM10009118_00980 [Wandonia haliotis]|uniref:Carbohydrate-binding module family 96 domain-containing protein n=1 Tax=Wandonia haliotis TaxID=574963 RepID=A0ABN1MKI1_9FLAO
MFVDQNCLPVRGRYAYVVALMALLLSIRLTSAQTTVTIESSADVLLTSLMPTTNFGTTTNIGVSRSTISFNFNTKSLLKFDLSSIPENAIITSAELILEVNSGTPFSFLFQQLTEDWSETTVTWNTIPTETTQYEFTEIPTVNSWPWDTNVKFHHFDELNLTTMVQRWINYPHLNHGMLIDRDPAAVADNSNSYKSREAGTSYIELSGGFVIPLYHSPRLIVRYVLPIEIDLVSVIHASGTSSGDGSITASASGGNGAYTYQWYNSSGSAIGTNSPTISGLNYGWYGVKVTDGLGVESYMSFIVGVECEKVSISYNPGPNYVNDTYITNFQTISSDLRDVNYGNTASFLVRRRYSTNGIVGYFDYRSLLRFLLTNDPNLKINKADLKIRVSSNSGTGNNPFLRLIAEDWQEHIVTHNHQPLFSSFIEKATGITSTGDQVIDVQEYWEYWRTSSNYGFLLELENPAVNANRMVNVYSSDYTANIGYRPQMEFEVTLTCPEYVTLKEKPDGGVYLLYRPVIRFYFNELEDAETGEQLKFEIRNSSNTIIASSGHSGAPTGIGSAVIHRTDGNYHIFDLSGISLPVDEPHTLTIYKIDGTKRYLNFKKVN